MASPTASLVRSPRLTWMMGPARGISLLTVGATPGTSESNGTGHPKVVSGGVTVVSIDATLLMPSSGAQPGFGFTWPVKSAISVPA